MVLIHIRRADGTEDDVDEARLKMIQVTVDDANERTTTVEYCLLECDGVAHTTRIAESPSHFCAQHVHRSVATQIKRWPDGLGAVLGSFT